MKRKSIRRQGIAYLIGIALSFILFISFLAYMTWPKPEEENAIMESMMLQDEVVRSAEPSFKVEPETNILTIELNPTTKFLGSPIQVMLKTVTGRGFLSPDRHSC